MAYNNSKGPRGFGDIKNEDDVDTQIDFESDSIGFKTNNIARFTINNTALSASQYTPLNIWKITGNGGREEDVLSISSSATEHEQGIQFTGSVGFSGSNYGEECSAFFYMPITSSTSISASFVESLTSRFEEINIRKISTVDSVSRLSISSSLTELNEGIGFTGSVGFSGSNFGEECKVSFHMPTATDSYLEFTEMSAPGNPATNVGRLYSADDSGTTKLFFKDSAGTATNLLAGGLEQANQGNNRVITSVDASNINAEANLTFDGNTLKAVGYVTSSLGVSSLSGSFEEGVAVGGSTIISADKDITNVRSLTASTNIYAANGYFTGILDVEGNVVLGNAASDITTITGRLTASQGLSIDVDDYPILLGAGADLSIKHDGNSKIKNTSGHITIDNEATSKDIRFVLASDSADTEAVKIRNDSNDNVWACDAAGNVSGSGTLQAVGNTFLGAALNVSGNADFDGTITCDDSITIDSTTISAAEIGVLDSVTPGTAAVSKAMVLDGSGDISGYRNLSGSGTLQVVGNTFVGGTLHVSGALSSSAGLGGLTLTVGGAGNRGFDEDAQLSVNAINANSQGINNAGAIAGATTISGSGNASAFTFTAEGGFKVGSTSVITEDKQLRARQIDVTRHHWENGSNANFKFISFMNASETNVGAATYTNSMVAPFNGRLVRIIAKFENAQDGNVNFSLHTGSGLTVSNTPFVEDITVSVANEANAVGVFNTTGSSHYEAGSLVGVGCKPNANPGRVSMVCIWEYDMTGL
jgi:hypothetical protein